jgi:hypothetical protein
MEKIADIVEANPCMSWFFQELAKDPGQKDAFIQLLKWFNALTPLGTSAIATLDLLGGVAKRPPASPAHGTRNHLLGNCRQSTVDLCTYREVYETTRKVRRVFATKCVVPHGRKSPNAGFCQCLWHFSQTCSSLAVQVMPDRQHQCCPNIKQLTVYRNL